MRDRGPERAQEAERGDWISWWGCGLFGGYKGKPQDSLSCHNSFLKLVPDSIPLLFSPREA